MKRIAKGVVRAAAAAFMLAAWQPAVFAQEQPAPRPLVRSIRATGEATVTAAPDRAQMNVAVTTQAPTADQAAADNARKTELVLAAVRRALEPGAQVTTVGYTITPNYVYPREGGEAKITGYTAANTLLVTTDDLKRVGGIIDAAVQAGANTIQGLQFTLKDEAPVEREALRRASERAMQRAQAIASGLGVTVTTVLEAEEGAAVIRPVAYEATAVRTASAQTPVEPGTVELHATVTVTVGIM